ncbi:MAG: hypothetical protein MI861_19350 [Pirellulales bacterium]|nr:hypothetical protein [Pirellulales bacterium]
MIAILSRFASRDSLLAAVAISVIMLAILRGQPRQEIVLVTQSGERQTHWLPLGDVRLTELLTQLERWKTRQTLSRRLVVARWQKEVADHYHQQHSMPSAKVLQVSFSDRTPEQDAEVTGRDLSAQGQRDYWKSVSEAMAKVVADESAKIARRRQASPSPPVMMGRVVAGRPGTSGIFIAILSGLLAAMLVSVWEHICPPITFRSRDQDVGESGEADSKFHQTLRVEVPARWVRIRQPVGVIVRQWSMAGVVLWALGLVGFWLAS